jgi:HSP20 family protein
MAERQNEQAQGQPKQTTTLQEKQGQSLPVQQSSQRQEAGLSRAGSPWGSAIVRDPFEAIVSSAAMNPFAFMRRFMEDMDSLFEDFGSSRYGQGTGLQQTRGARLWSPQIETFERQGELVVRADLPGLSKDDVRVRLDDDVLTLEGERRYEHDETRGGVYHSERSYGSFKRAVRLPEGVDPESVKASFDNGVLEVTMAAPQRKTTGRTIEVQSGGATGEQGSAATNVAAQGARDTTPGVAH